MSKHDDDTFIEMKGIGKQYGGVTALEDVDFRVKSGEAICLAGENGSGKSTLIKILVGVGLFGIIEGLVLVTYQCHIWIVCLLMGDATVNPLIVRLRCQRSNEDSVFTFATHTLGHLFHQIGTEVFILESFNVVMNILLACRFVRDHSNTLIHCALQHWLKCLGRHRHNGQRIYSPVSYTHLTLPTILRV